MEHPVASLDLVRPWRTATLVASAVAVLELVVILAAGAAIFGHTLGRHEAAPKAAAAEVAAAPPPRPSGQPKAGAPTLSRTETSVLVLNGNGRTGAASEAAGRVRALGYVVGGTGNAPHTGYAQSMIMYRSRYRPEAERLARDLHVKIIGPLDGLQPSALMGAHLALVLGG